MYPRNKKEYFGANAKVLLGIVLNLDVLILLRDVCMYYTLCTNEQIKIIFISFSEDRLDWLQSLKQFFINVSYHVLVASLILMALF